MPNAYCDHLRITPPRLLDVAIGPARRHIDALVIALLAHGEPMHLDEIVTLLAPMWEGPRETLRVTLQKAWGGREPVVRQADGRLGLDVTSSRMGPLLEHLGLRARPRPPEFVQPGPDVPLTREEIDAAFEYCVPTTVSGCRLAAAMLDLHDRPMRPEEILAALPTPQSIRAPQPAESPRRSTPRLVTLAADGRLVLDRASPELAATRINIRRLARVRLRTRAERVFFQQRAAELRRAEEARLAALPPVPPASAKIAWRGVLVSVQPRIRLTRWYDQRSHTYLGSVLRVRGARGDGPGALEPAEFSVALGKGAQAKHQFRVGDEVSGEGVAVADPDLHTADLYKVSALKVHARGPAERSASAPYTGALPPLDEYRARGPRRLAARTYAATCRSCLWGAEMAVEIVIDSWNSSRRRYRRETACYGPKGCPLYAAGPCRRVPGRHGSSWTEEDWVDGEATRHRGEGE